MTIYDDYVKNPHFTVYQPFYIHNTLLSMYSGIFNWFLKDYYCDFKFYTMSTHDKMQEEIEKFQKENKSIERPPLPAINFNPFGDIAIEENFPNLWRSSYLAPHLARKILSNEPDYIDDYFEFYIVYKKIRGNAEVILWLSSVGEYLDHRLQLIDWFHGGFNRRIRISSIQTEVIIPAELIETAYQDAPYDWSNTPLSKKLIKTMNQDKYIYPIYLNPQIWMTSIGDASQIYGEDSISEYKIQVTFEYNCMIPSYFIVKANTRPKHIRISLNFDPFILESLETVSIYDEDSNDEILSHVLPAYKVADEDYYYSVVPDVDKRFIYSKDIVVIDKNSFTPGSTPGPKGVLLVPEIMVPYMLPYMNKIMICENKNYIFDKYVRYEFDEDTEAGTLIDITSYNIKDYIQILIGNGKDALVEGDVYRLVYDSNQELYTHIELLKDVPAGEKWDFIFYAEQ